MRCEDHPEPLSARDERGSTFVLNVQSSTPSAAASANRRPVTQRQASAGSREARLLLVSLADVLAVRVFTAGDANVTCFRIPAIVATPTGALLAFAEARHGSCADDATREIALRRSADGGRTWSEIAFVAGNASLPVGNPYPISDATQVALVVVLHADARASARAAASRAGRRRHRGRRSRTRTLAPRAPNSPARAPASRAAAAGSRLRLGACIDDVTLSDDAGAAGAPRAGAAPFASMDGGARRPRGRRARSSAAAEPTLGRVSRSFDGGLSWSNVSFDAALVGPVYKARSRHLAAGRPARGPLYFSNPTGATARGPVRAALRRRRPRGAAGP